jgi:hypothetical protein
MNETIFELWWYLQKKSLDIWELHNHDIGIQRRSCRDHRLVFMIWKETLMTHLRSGHMCPP